MAFLGNNGAGMPVAREVAKAASEARIEEFERQADHRHQLREAHRTWLDRLRARFSRRP